MTETIALSTDTVRAHVDGPVGWITLNNPDRHNAISPAMFTAIGEAVDAHERRTDVRVVAITGAGEKAFASGADIGELSGDAAALPTGLTRLSECRLPTLAVIRGWCIGGGLMTALSTDLRIAAENAIFAIPAGRLGVGYPLSATHRLVEVIGSAAATELLLTAARWPADVAFAHSLIHRIVPADELDTRVSELVATLAANAPLSATASKVAIASASGRQTTAAATAAIHACWNSDDFREGRAAFAEKRTPEFHGS